MNLLDSTCMKKFKSSLNNLQAVQLETHIFSPCQWCSPTKTGPEMDVTFSMSDFKQRLNLQIYVQFLTVVQLLDLQWPRILLSLWYFYELKQLLEATFGTTSKPMSNFICNNLIQAWFVVCLTWTFKYLGFFFFKQKGCIVFHVCLCSRYKGYHKVVGGTVILSSQFQ